MSQPMQHSSDRRAQAHQAQRMIAAQLAAGVLAGRPGGAASDDQPAAEVAVKLFHDILKELTDTDQAPADQA